MTTAFLTFYQSLAPDPAKRGKQFEHFVKWFLQNDPEWQTQVDQVWLWDEWPQRWGADCGVDLVFRHKNGDHWGVQAKCYAPDYDITKHDVDKFLSESNRPLIQHRLLIATTDRIGNNAKQVCDAQDKPVIRFLLSDFEKSALDYPANLSELPQAQRKPRPEPRDHQNEAIAAVSQGLQTADRGQLIMACGTGKTYVTLWIKEALNAQRTLVLVPSLGLLSQLLREWTFAAATPFEVLCVCSDQTVGSKGNDEAIHSVADLAFPVTSDADEVKRFLSGAGNRVVFSTYQSSLVVAAAQADASIPAFDLAVADEAHRCAGKVGSDFTAILDNTQIRSTKRLFATATPRTYSSTVKKAAEERGVEVVGMDDAEKFGEVLYALPFGKAIERKLLTDYRVVIIGVDDPTIAQWIAKRELVSLSLPRPLGEGRGEGAFHDQNEIRAATNSPLLPQAGEAWPVLSLSKEDEGREHNAQQQPKAINTSRETDSESLAAQIGLLKAIKDYDLKRIISFHSRVKRAEDFTTDMQNTLQWISDEHRPSGTLRTDFVSGNMPANKRKIKLDQLKALSADERGVLSNARCLSEGVDVPSLDGVAFIDPRSSQVDIIQAVGRAIRLSPDKKAGTIVLPVFIASGEDATSTIEASNFKPIWDVLNALKAHDDVLACELDQLRTEMGRKTGNGVSAESLRKISIDLPATVGAGFGGALRTHLVEQVTAFWNFWFGLLELFVEREGHCFVPQQYKVGDDNRLGGWVSNQRSRKDLRTIEQIKRLEALPGWVWDVRESQWEEGFLHLKAFAEHVGHSKVSSKHRMSDGYQLGIWVGNQRGKKDTMSTDRKARLDALPGWTWDSRTEQWEEGFRHLKEFVDRMGHCKFSNNYKSSDGYRLGQWVGAQRAAKDKLSTERKVRLEALPGWVWVANDARWEEGFGYLKEFVNQKGHCNISQDYKTDNGYRLGKWVSHQRMATEGMDAERKSRLDILPGWAWDALDNKWEVGYTKLKEFTLTNGHSNVPMKHVTSDGYKLGQWISGQRQLKSSMFEERKARLELLPGWIWVAKVVGEKKEWDEWFQLLKDFSELEGHCMVSRKYTTVDGALLGSWVGNQRTNKDRLLPEMRTRLETLSGWVWNSLDDAWEEGYGALQVYVAQEGHSKVVQTYVTMDGYRLGGWVRRQRAEENSMTMERKARLEALPGWSWNALEEAWEEGFRYLTVFAEQHGHCRVSDKFITAGGFRLGQWVGIQRSRKEKMTEERKVRLESLPGWVWDAVAALWDEGFRYLAEYSNYEGHCRVPQKYKTVSGYQLGVWVSRQRGMKDSMSSERKTQLIALPGWFWRNE